jgi:hypothetical protein
MTDIAPFPFVKPENAPTVPAEGRFLLPVCITEEELHILLGAALLYAELDDTGECRHLWPLLQAMDYIGQPEYAACLGLFEDLDEPECDNYLPYAPFADYYPTNPYNDPDEIPPDYLVPPFLRNTDFDYPELFGYKASDVFVPFAAINIAPENVFTLNYPQIKISVRGSGQIELDLLAVQQGGHLVLKVGSPPNIFDILSEVIIEAGVRIIDLDNDSTSIPPEEDIVISEEVNIEAAVNETTDVYLVFVPKLDDSLIPLGFGGGIRSIGLCGFEQDAMMAGVEDVRYNETTGDLEKRIDGVWTVFATCEELVACAPVGGGGGGGALGVAKAYSLDVVTNKTTSSASFVDSTLVVNHTSTKPNLLVVIDNVQCGHSAGGKTEIQVRLDDAAGVSEAIGFNLGSERREVQSVGVFENVAAGSHELNIYWRTSAATATIFATGGISVHVIEFDEFEGVFVEDVRISGGELQKKIGGVWLNVTDSLAAMISSINSQISAINATNASQQATINTHTSQISILNSTTALHTSQIAGHETRIDELESNVGDLVSIDIPQINLTLENHEARIDALEAAGGSSEGWGVFKINSVQHAGASLNPSGGIYSILEGSYSAGGPGVPAGILANASGEIEIEASNAMRYGSCVVVGFLIYIVNAGSYQFMVSVNSGQEVEALIIPSTGNYVAWLVVEPNLVGLPPAPADQMEIIIRETTGSASAADWRLQQANYLCVQINPFTQVLFP